MKRTQVCAQAGENRSAEARGSEGGQVEIRPTRGGDRDAIREFLGGLSLRARYLRFFTGAVSGGSGLLNVLTGSQDNVDAVVATEDGTIIGHAMAADMADSAGAHVAEIGVVVTDARQGRGIGSALVREVVARAQTRGATAVAMEVLAENRQVLTMVAKHWPVAHHTHSGAYVTIRAGMPEDTRAEVDVRAVPRLALEGAPALALEGAPALVRKGAPALVLDEAPGLVLGEAPELVSAEVR